MQKRIQRCAEIDCENCVACGCCAKTCSRAAASVFRGIYAEIDEVLCVGCGRCVIACPASVITIKEKTNEKTLA
ncbi:MAG: 4Fe-4S dicluster domain-containing protein [Oscillospiraceae bacterium]